MDGDRFKGKLKSRLRLAERGRPSGFGCGGRPLGLTSEPSGGVLTWLVDT
jgi:hypothetical protein